MESQQSLDDIAIYCPQVKADLIPMKNQEFHTLEDAETFYKSYAKESGFDVKRHSNKKKDGVIVRKEYACSKEGTSKVTGKKRKRNQTRQNCKAKIVVVKRAPIGKYVVTIFVEGHNHPLTTPRRKLLTKIHRGVSSVHKSLSKQLTAVNVPPCKQFDFLGVNSGGLENIGCLQQDIYNYRRDCRKEVKGHDGDMLHEYFLHEKEKDPSFNFKIEADNENRITHIFWADAISRRSYKFYGDVVIFDTTYNTNAYSLIFAPLVGVNNHGQTIILACAFLSNERTDSFTWFFKEFLKAMPGDAPRMIITDQDPAMTKAISEVLPQTFHRDEFDDRWTTIVESSGLSDNGWLKTMYDIRSTWVPAYVNHMFSAGMSSSQRAESGHAFYKRFISKENTLIDFMIQFSRAVTRQRHMELIEDHVDINEKPNFDSQFEMADQMARVYTHECFKEFYAQLSQCCNYRFELSHENDTYMVYTALRKKMENPKGRVITYAKDSDFVSCSCKKFEMAGIPCRHILTFLIFIRLVDTLPDQYILKRWTKSIKDETVLDDAGVEITDNRDLLARRSRLCQYAVEVIDKIIGSEEASALFLDSLKDVLDKHNHKMADGEDVNFALVPFEQKCLPSQHIYNEPVQVRAKGCGKRLKAGKEKGRLKAAKKANGKGRFCHGCKKHDQQHDKRNCPELKNINGIPIAQTGEFASDPSTDDEEYSSTGVDESA
ncbi:hypothetical protein ACLB2K_016717 [Fragaria x ananassa]